MEDDEFLHFGNLEACSQIEHLVSQKVQGAPLGFSLALHTGEDARAIEANRRRLASHFGPQSRFVSVLQVHGDAVHVVEEAREHGWRRLDESVRADALITDLPNVVLSILTADCVPLLLFDPKKRAIAAVHAGWRGANEGIVAKTIETMKERYGSDAFELIAAIGPAIGGCCYEVGEEVVRAFSGFPSALREDAQGRSYLDLKEVVRLQLLGSGLQESSIECSGICTACERESFFSYRAQGGCSGRFISCIMLKE